MNEYIKMNRARKFLSMAVGSGGDGIWWQWLTTRGGGGGRRKVIVSIVLVEDSKPELFPTTFRQRKARREIGTRCLESPKNLQFSSLRGGSGTLMVREKGMEVEAKVSSD
ncbi:hypothetical protein F511_11633 [Dorcoceras hygrometricum]|uniref:Uncharacterized protein n=1 Tax=Dorcoceras hygrometricum TaxID=472368 RepID=A0A2Z7AJX3_9LAMI|nr:hypothetical protein F511_11633 [Dorcoceras hygrometricum]